MKSINTKGKVILHILKGGTCICIYCNVKKLRYYNANKVYIEKLLISDKDDHIKQKWGLKCTKVGANVNEKFNMP